MIDRVGQIFILPACCVVVENLGSNLPGDPLWRIMFLETGRTMRLNESYLAERERNGHRVT